MTNADRIRAMSDEELMKAIFDELPCEDVCRFCVPTMRADKMCDWHCKNGILKWLQQPVKEDA